MAASTRGSLILPSYLAFERGQRRLGARQLVLFDAFGAGDITARLLHLGGEGVDGLLHIAKRLELETIDHVHRIIDVLEGALERLERDGRGCCLLVDLAGL